MLVDPNALELLHAADVDQQRRSCQSQLQRRDQRVATGDNLGCFRITLQQIDCVSERTDPDVVESSGNHRLAPVCAAWTAAQIRGGVRGMSRWVMPNGCKASSTAWTMQGGAAIDPLSPMPLTPSGLVGEGVS